MKKNISIILSVCMIFACVSVLASCSKKHVIEADAPTGDLALATPGDGVVYMSVTDVNGDVVTNVEGETVTVAVPASEQTTAVPAGQESTAANAEETSGSVAAPDDPSAVPSDPAGSGDASVKQGEYVLTLSANKTTVKAGDTLVLTYHMKNCKNVACASFTVEAGDDVTVTDYESNDFSNQSKESFDIYSNSTDEGVLFGGMISTTCDFIDADLFTVTYRVKNTVNTGDKLTFRVVPTTFLVGTDSSGKTTLDYCDKLEKATLTVTVQNKENG